MRFLWSGGWAQDGSLSGEPRNNSETVGLKVAVRSGSKGLTVTKVGQLVNYVGFALATVYTEMIHTVYSLS